MPKRSSARIQEHFVGLTDPRRRKVVYPLINIVTIAVCAVICGEDDFVAIAECSVPRDLPDRKRWPGLAAIGWTINDTTRDGNRCYKTRYYILSRKLSAKAFAAAVRGHWSIENSLHWQLDVTFGEDQSRLRRGHADANFSILRRTALSMLTNNTTLEVGVKNKRLAAGWDAYLQQVLLRQ